MTQMKAKAKNKSKGKTSGSRLTPRRDDDGTHFTLHTSHFSLHTSHFTLLTSHFTVNWSELRPVVHRSSLLLTARASHCIIL